MSTHLRITDLYHAYVSRNVLGCWFNVVMAESVKFSSIYLQLNCLWCHFFIYMSTEYSHLQQKKDNNFQRDFEHNTYENNSTFSLF